MRKDLHNNTVGSVALAAAISSNTTTAGNIIDTRGFEAIEFYIASGTLTDGAYAVLVEDGDESNLSDAAAVADDELLGTEANASFADTDDDTVKRIGYIGGKRYVRLSLVSTGVTTGGSFTAIAVQGTASNNPTEGA